MFVLLHAVVIFISNVAHQLVTHLLAQFVPICPPLKKFIITCENRRLLEPTALSLKHTQPMQLAVQYPHVSWPTQS